MPSLVIVILIAFAAGAVGTMIGGILGVIFKKPKKIHIAMVLAFAGGAMIGISLLELMPEAYAGGGLPALLIGLFLGCAVVFLLELLNERLKRKKEELQLECAVHCEKRKLRGVGIAIFLAMILHTLPEGVAIGAGYHAEIGFLLGAVMLLHYIPEGLAIAVPLKASGKMSNLKIIGLCFAAGFPTLIGAILGYYLGMNATLIAYTLSFAAGVMLYIVFSQMLPIAYQYTDKFGIITLMLMLGVIVTIVFGALLY
jgi:ZIP family zinc transporter